MQTPMNINKLVILNNKILRILQNVSRHTHTAELYTKFNTLSIPAYGAPERTYPDFFSITFELNTITCERIILYRSHVIASRSNVIFTFAREDYVCT